MDRTTRRSTNPLLPILLLLSAIPSAASADNAQVTDNLLSHFYDFVQAFEAKDPTQLKPFMHAQTKLGQDLGSAGAALLDYVQNSEHCHERLLNALYAGCKLIRQGEMPGCIAPPQAADDSILYIGPRIAFTSDSGGETFTVQFLNCGSD